MKKIVALMLALMMVFTLVACGGGASGEQPSGEQPSGSGQPETSAPEETAPVGGEVTDVETGDAWYFEADGVKVYMSADGAETVAALGEPMGYFENEGCAGLGVEKTYSYAGFELMTYQDEATGVDKVYSVYFTDDTCKTPEGIRVGDTVDQAMAAYACEYEAGEPQIILTKGNCTLYLNVTDGVVMGVEYVANDAINA